MICPKCQAQGGDIQPASNKNAQYAIYTACATFFLIVVTLFSTSSWLVAIVACVVIGVVGHTVRVSFLKKSQSYQCSRCRNVFYVDAAEQEQLAKLPPPASAAQPTFCPKCGSAWVAGTQSCPNCG